MCLAATGLETSREILDARPVMSSVAAELAEDDYQVRSPGKRSKGSSSSSSRFEGGGGRTARVGTLTKLMRTVTAVAVAVGGFVSLVGVMGAVGFITENVWVRLIVGVTVVVATPAILADRLLKRANATLATRGGLGTVANVFAIVLLGFALTLVSADGLTKGLFAREGDRYARSGSSLMARAVYFIGSESPVFTTAPSNPSKASSASSASSLSTASKASGAASGEAAPSPIGSSSASEVMSAAPLPSP